MDRLTANLHEGLLITLRKLPHPVPGERYQTEGELVEHLGRWLGELTFTPADVVVLSVARGSPLSGMDRATCEVFVA